MNEADYCLGFSNAAGIGPKGFQRLLKVFGTAQNAWERNSKEKFKDAGIGENNFARFKEFKNSFDIINYLSRLKKAKVEFVPFGSELYPKRLIEIDSPPIGLYIKGNKQLLIGQEVIGVVGARKITSYGREVTGKLVGELCGAGFTIASGMALGVDGVAHKSAIDSKGATIAVLGCGVDCAYPRENERLYESILDTKGLVISEYPLGMLATKGTFPARNRLIAGISCAVLITEAAEDSGSLITADYAIKQGKVVFAVPGPITSRMSDGTTKLLKQNAKLVTSAQDILDHFNIKDKKSNIKNTYRKLNLSITEEKIFKVLENEEMTIDEISKLTKIKIGKLSILLSEMELQGLIKRSYNGALTLKS